MIADAAMNARIIGLQMLKRGFSRGYAAGVISYGSLLTPIIPPGIGFILYGTVGQVSIGRLFAAGFVPGLMLWAALAITISITARKRGYMPEREKRPTVKEIALASWGGIWAILFPDHPAGRAALRHLHAVRDRRLRGDLRGRGRLLRLPHADAEASFHEALEGSLVDVGARDVPARALGDLRLRHRVRAHARGHLRLDARRHRQPQPA